MAKEREPGFFKEFSSNLAPWGGIAALFAGLAIIQVISDPKGTIEFLADVTGTEAGITDLPDCQTETSKTIQVEGNTYTITCQP